MKINLEPDHQISSQCPIWGFFNSDHQFFLGALSQKKRKKGKKKNEKKKHDSMMKTRKGQSRAKMRKLSKTYGQNE